MLTRRSGFDEEKLLDTEGREDEVASVLAQMRALLKSEKEVAGLVRALGLYRV